jgi:hypothetical protein
VAPTAEEEVVAVEGIIIRHPALGVAAVLAVHETVTLTIVVVEAGIDLKTAITKTETAKTPIEDHHDRGWAMSWEAYYLLG